MKKISIALFSTSSVHAPHYINSLPLDSRYNWVASSVAKEDRGIPDLKNIPNYVKIYEREEDLLNAHPDLDAVILCGSNNLTFNQFKLCAERGIKNVILMKIPTMFINEYEEMQRLAKENDMKVVGEAADGEEALKIIDYVKPDVVLLDLVMPKLDGIGVMENAVRNHKK